MAWWRRLWKKASSLPPTPTTVERGAWAEQLAERHLRGHGLRPLQRNYHCRDGELDLIMRHGEALVFVEVRYRAESGYGGALASIDAGKRRRIVDCARIFLAAYPREARRECRFDVVAVDGSPERHRIEWIQSAL